MTKIIQNINLIGINHKHAEIELRDNLAIPMERMDDFLTEIKTNFSNISECCIISTCNRTEIIFISKDSSSIQWINQWLANYGNIDSTVLLNSIYIHQGIEAIRHLMKVASGLDSMVLGEPQILGQIKQSVAIAKENNAIKNDLAIIFDNIFTCAKRIRSQTHIGKCPVSMVFSTTKIVEDHFNNKTNNIDNNILLIGIGDTGKLLIKHLINDTSNQVYITNRTDIKAENIAAQYGISSIDWVDYKKSLHNFDVIICATQSEHYLITRQDIQSESPVLLIDLSMPRNIDPEISKMINVTLLNIDDIGAFIQENALKRSQSIPHAEKIINSQIDYLIEQSKFNKYHSEIKKFRDYTKNIGDQINKKIKEEILLGSNPEQAIKEYSYLFTQKWLHLPNKKIQEWIKSGKSITPDEFFELFNHNIISEKQMTDNLD